MKMKQIPNGLIKIRYGKDYSREYLKKLSNKKIGELNPSHKLTIENVIEIKKLWSLGDYTTTSLGKKFNISRQSIADIVYGRTWKHLE